MTGPEFLATLAAWDEEATELDDWIRASNWWFKFWFAYYRVKRWIKQLVAK